MFLKVCSFLTCMVFSLPFQIRKNVLVKNYNTFVDCNESTGYKFYWEDKNVYIIEMANVDHKAAMSVLMKYFDLSNNGVLLNPSIKVLGQPCKRFPFNMLVFGLIIYHFNPISQDKKIAPDVMVYPDTAHVSQLNIPHSRPLPSDINVLLVFLLFV
jgi:hypothetical protein